MLQHYACGFLFSENHARVVLIRKRRPHWQAGKLNGVGGKLEPGETALDAMRREFREEAGVDIDTWQHILTLSGEAWAGHFFRAFGDVDSVRSMTDEQLEIHRVGQLPHDTIPNLRWMIPLLLDDEPACGAYELHYINCDAQNPPNRRRPEP
jgi:8-oxo-dGTP diphosphatase